MAFFFGLKEILMEKKRLRILRIENDLTQIQLSSEVDINPTKLSHIERGNVEANDREKSSLAGFFELRVEDILWPIIARSA